MESQLAVYSVNQDKFEADDDRAIISSSPTLHSLKVFESSEPVLRSLFVQKYKFVLVFPAEGLDLNDPVVESYEFRKLELENAMA